MYCGGPLKKYPRQVEALKNGQMTLAVLGPFLGGALFALPLFCILCPGLSPWTDQTRAITTVMT